MVKGGVGPFTNMQKCKMQNAQFKNAKCKNAQCKNAKYKNAQLELHIGNCIVCCGFHSRDLY